MKNKSFLFLVCIFLLSIAKVSFANVFINEVQIETDNSKDDEFIELYNSGNSEIDLTGFAIYKKTSSGTESQMIAKSRFENVKIPALGFLFLAKEGGYLGSKTPDIFWPNSYSLAQNNSLTLYKDFDNKIIEDSAFWGEVKNFKHTNSNNGNSESENIQNTENLSSSNIVAPTNTSSVLGSKLKPNLKIMTKSFGFVNEPFYLEAVIENEEYKNLYGKYIWNFGDGDYKEVKSLDNTKFSHNYFYSGEYFIYLEYYKNLYEKEPDMIAKTNIQIFEPTIVISNTGDEDNFFIELSNKSKADIDLSNFILKGFNKNFIFPKNTFLNSNKKIILPTQITQFTFADKNYLEIIDSSNKIIFSQKINLERKIATPSISKKVAIDKGNIITNSNIEIPSFDFGEKINSEALTSASVLAPYVEEKDNNSEFVLFFVLFLIAVSSLVYFIRRSSKIKESDEEDRDEDFEILDE